MSELFRSFGKYVRKFTQTHEKSRFSESEKEELRKISDTNTRMILGRLSLDPIPNAFEVDQRAGLLLTVMDSSSYIKTSPRFDASQRIHRSYELQSVDPSIVRLCEDGLSEVIQSATMQYVIDEELTGRIHIKSLLGEGTTLHIPHEVEILVFHKLPATLRKEELVPLLQARGYEREQLSVIRTQFMQSPEKCSFVLHITASTGEIEERRFSGIPVKNHPRSGELSYFQHIPSPVSESERGRNIPMSIHNLLQTLPSRA